MEQLVMNREISGEKLQLIENALKGNGEFPKIDEVELGPAMRFIVDLEKSYPDRVKENGEGFLLLQYAGNDAVIQMIKDKFESLRS